MDNERNFENLTEDEKIDIFINYMASCICNREDLLRDLRHSQYYFDWASKNAAKGAMKSFYENIAGMLDRAIKEVQFKKLLDFWSDNVEDFKMDDAWCYSFDISVEKGIVLNLNHISDFFGDDAYIDFTFENILSPARKYSVNEYAQLYGIQPVTVRQWIRRGKIKEAVKCGNEWMISELVTPVVKRGFTGGTYHCDEPYSGAPDNFAFLNGHTGFGIVKDYENKGHYKLEFEYPEVYEKSFTVSEKEQLEYYMICDKRFKTYGSTILFPDLTDEEWDRMLDEQYTDEE